MPRLTPRAVAEIVGVEDQELHPCQALRATARCPRRTSGIRAWPPGTPPRPPGPRGTPCGVVGLDRVRRRRAISSIVAEREQARRRWAGTFSKPVLCAITGLPRGQVTGVALAEPAAPQAHVLVLGHRPLRPRAAEERPGSRHGSSDISSGLRELPAVVSQQRRGPPSSSTFRHSSNAAGAGAAAAPGTSGTRGACSSSRSRRSRSTSLPFCCQLPMVV